MQGRNSDSAVRTITGVALICAPLFLAILLALHPQESKDASEQVQIIAAHAARWNAVHALFIVIMPLFLISAAGLAYALWERAPRAGLVGAALMAAGALFYCALFGAELALSAVATVPESQRAGIIPGAQAIIDGKGALPIVYLSLLFHVGLLVIAVALARTRTAPRWVAFVIGAGAVALVSANFSDPLGAVSAGILFVGLGALGMQVLRTPKAEVSSLTTRPTPVHP